MAWVLPLYGLKANMNHAWGARGFLVRSVECQNAVASEIRPSIVLRMFAVKLMLIFWR